MIAFFIMFGLSVLLGPVVIPILRRVKAGQTVRSEGPQTHLKKTGTPTMGGFIFLIPLIVVSIFMAKSYPGIIPIMILTVGFGLVGFVDDYIKVVLKRSMGLRAWQKMALQFVITGVFAFYITKYTNVELTMIVPFAPTVSLNLGIMTIPAMFFIVIATVNGTNFTDGIDGLSASVTAVVAGFFTVIGILQNSDVSVMGAMFLGGLLGYLVYNLHPAKVFMGDTGSLALGGFVAGCAYMLRMPLFIVIVGFVYLAEVVSVILQVGYFKLTHGKRLFKMAPIHHHFELSGWSETKVVGVFSIVTFVLCLVGLWGYLG